MLWPEEAGLTAALAELCAEHTLAVPVAATAINTAALNCFVNFIRYAFLFLLCGGRMEPVVIPRRDFFRLVDGAPV